MLVTAAELSSTPRWSPAWLCRRRPVRWLGDNSYSLYLWHWPLIIAAPSVTHQPLSGPGRLAVLALSLALAAPTRRFIEDPIRLGTRWRSRTWLAYGFAAVGMVGLVSLCSSISIDVQSSTRKAVAAERRQADTQTRSLLVTHRRSCFGAAVMDPQNRCPHPYARPKRLDTTFAAGDGRGDPCLQNYDAATPAPCTLGRKTAPKRTIAIVGNSHAWRLVPAVALYGQQSGWRITVATRINCLGLITTAVSPGGVSGNCLRWAAAVQHQLLTLPHLDAVIFPSYRYANAFTAGHSANPGQIHAVQQQILTLWSALAAHGTRVIVTDDVPGMRPTADPECIAASKARYDPCAVNRTSVVAPNLTTTLAQQPPQLASYLPLTQYFCDPSRCRGLIGGVVVYFDSHHLTTTYSRSLARYLGAEVTAALP